MKLITTLTFISLLIMYIAISVLIVIELFKIYRLTKRNTVVTLGRLIQPIEKPFTNIKSKNQIIKEAIIELDKKATLEHKQQNTKENICYETTHYNTAYNELKEFVNSLNKELKDITNSMTIASSKRIKQYEEINKTLKEFNKQQQAQANYLSEIKTSTLSGKYE